MTSRVVPLLEAAFGVVSLTITAIAAPDVRVYVMEPPVTNAHVVAGKPLPSECKAKREIRMAACRGEYEPASIVVQTNGRLEAALVVVDPLKGKHSTLAPDCFDIRAAQPQMRRVFDLVGGGVLDAPIPWLLVHDPAMVATPPGQSTEFTRAPVDAASLQPADIDGTRQFWITLRVPLSAEPGVYTGRIRVVSAKSPVASLKLTVRVYPFDLKPPKQEYSVYYPAYLKADDNLAIGVLTDQQYLTEMRNMAAHGCMNPTIYQGPLIDKQGKLDFTVLDRKLRLREEAGMPKGVSLYLLGVGGAPVLNTAFQVPGERARYIGRVREIVEWVRARGYADTYLYGVDEATGEHLKIQRDVFAAVHEGGGKVFVANFGDFFDLIGDVLDLPVLLHPAHGYPDHGSLWNFHPTPPATRLDDPERMRKFVNSKGFLGPGPRVQTDKPYQEIIRGVHRNGFKVFSYMDLLAGYTLPRHHRLLRGFALWKADLDGTMTWSYGHIGEPIAEVAGPIGGAPVETFVCRTKAGPIDTLSWEAYREGYDDARYLATLQDALVRANQSSSAAQRGVARRAQRWLDSIDVLSMDPDAVRAEMARLIGRL